MPSTNRRYRVVWSWTDGDGSEGPFREEWECVNASRAHDRCGLVYSMFNEFGEKTQQRLIDAPTIEISNDYGQTWPSMPSIVESPDVLTEVKAERDRQDTLWGEQNHKPLRWLGILMEEAGEVAKEIIDASSSQKLSDNYREELIQVAAVAVAAIESLDRQVSDA